VIGNEGVTFSIEDESTMAGPDIDFRVSVVITSFNHKRYLMEAVDSVLNQTLPVHEIIIADDASTDGSQDVIADYQRSNPKTIKSVLHPVNVGIPKNRNAALREVTGTYVAILDGDDKFRPNKLERERDGLREHPSARCVYSNIAIVDSEGTFQRIRDTRPQPSGNVFRQVAGCRFGLLRSMVMDASLVRRAGGMDERFPRYDGYDLTVQLAKWGAFAYWPEPLLDYRVHPTSDSKTLRARDHLNDLAGIYNKMRPMLADLPTSDKARINAVWTRRLLEWRLKDALQTGRRWRASAIALMGLIRGAASTGDIRRIVSEVTPPIAGHGGRQLIPFTFAAKG
jgi:glycosyltransferase involved in cell wall biosynthesis